MRGMLRWMLPRIKNGGDCMTPLQERLKILNDPPPGAENEPVLIGDEEHWYFPESGVVESVELREPEPAWLSRGPDDEFDETERH